MRWKTQFLLDSDWSYSEVWAYQKKLVEDVASGESPETLIFCEHEEVLTAGRRFVENNVKDSSLPLHKIERGGDVTWHGPGQLVVYPIFKLHGEHFQKGLHDFLRFWEDCVISFLSELGVDAGRYGPTGVWVQGVSSSPKKIASLGIAVRKWVTYHGLSLNVSNHSTAFSSIRPCNFDSDVMTTLVQLGFDFDVEEVACRLLKIIESKLQPESQLRGALQSNVKEA